MKLHFLVGPAKYASPYNKHAQTIRKENVIKQEEHTQNEYRDAKAYCDAILREKLITEYEKTQECIYNFNKLREIYKLCGIEISTESLKI